MFHFLLRALLNLLIAAPLLLLLFWQSRAGKDNAASFHNGQPVEEIDIWRATKLVLARYGA
jgi:hypothetical protein